MSTPTGPLCECGCGKRVPRTRVTRCPWCRRVLRMDCKCPGKCWRFFAPNSTEEKT